MPTPGSEGGDGGLTVVLKRFFWCLVVLAAAVDGAYRAFDAAGADMRSDFARPPFEYKPRPLWFWSAPFLLGKRLTSARSRYSTEQSPRLFAAISESPDSLTLRSAVSGLVWYRQRFLLEASRGLVAKAADWFGSGAGSCTGCLVIPPSLADEHLCRACLLPSAASRRHQTAGKPAR
jgi:hypothetical protein